VFSRAALPSHFGEHSTEPMELGRLPAFPAERRTGTVRDQRIRIVSRTRWDHGVHNMPATVRTHRCRGSERGLPGCLPPRFPSAAEVRGTGPCPMKRAGSRTPPRRIGPETSSSLPPNKSFGVGVQLRFEAVRGDFFTGACVSSLRPATKPATTRRNSAAGGPPQKSVISCCREVYGTSGDGVRTQDVQRLSWQS